MRAGVALAGIGAFALALGTGTARDAAQAARAPLTGDWGVRIVEPTTRCEWTGTIRLLERGGRLSGRGRADPTPESPRCPRLAGSVDGEVGGDDVRFGFGTGPLGRAEFEGRAAPDARAMDGTWSTRRAEGRWAAAR